VSTKTAGDIFTFTDDVGLGLVEWTSEIVQLNPDRSIIKGSAWTSSGLFSNRFGGPLWAHGSASDPPTASAVDINTTTNAFNANEFSMLRVNCHHGTAPFFSFINDSPLNGVWYSHNKVAVRTVEQARRFHQDRRRVGLCRTRPRLGTPAAQECWVGSARMFWVWYGPDVTRIRADGRPGAWQPADIMTRLRSDAQIITPTAMTAGV
jgi:hypothetical protein